MTASLLIDTETQIAADPLQVWAILTDFAGYPRWNPFIIEVTGTLLAGSELRLKSVHIPGKPPTDGIATLIEAGFPDMRWESGHPDRSVLKGDHFFRCQAAGGGCRFHHFEQFSGISAERLLNDFGRRIEANFRIFNQALKRAAEL